MTASAQIAGFTSANIAEVEAGTKALRTTLRPEDYGSLGIYSAGGVSGIMAASIANDSMIMSWRWADATRLALVKRVTISAGCDTVAFAAGTFYFQLFSARSFTVSDSGGLSLLPSGSQNKLRTTGMGTTLLTDFRISNTAALTSGAGRTNDTNPIGTVVGSVPATIGTPMLAPFPLLDQRPGEHPLLVAVNEGLVITVRVPLTGTWKFAAKVDWTEITAY